MKFEFEKLRSLLRKRADDPAVIELIERQYTQINRSAYQGYVSIPQYGVSVMFKEAPWVVPVSEIQDPKMLHLDAFHFHSEGHEGHSQYSGCFPGGIAFGDSETAVRSKLGPPSTSGGGGFSKMLKKTIPHWVKYSLGSELLHIQLDPDGKVDMITLYTPDLQSKQP